ncbi:hypothetical protein F4781DRAFT_279831 [Annulohypoxylon bovei var. microspora]|nr:hypothetical protein F4781DRAFT_279831 [Annulohypoxylon bovei var. microspora]
MMRLHLSLLLIGVLVSYVAAASKLLYPYTLSPPASYHPRPPTPIHRANLSAAAPTFCKCTCFKNSTLIQLGPQGDNPNTFESAHSAADPPTPPPSSQALLSRSLANPEKRAASASCTQCTRAFCLSQHLPICKDAEENDDVVAMCFQRDSRKDQIIVWGFILGTTGLLGWAAARRVVEFRDGKKGAALGAGSGSGRGQDRGVYMPVGRDGT